MGQHGTESTALRSAIGKYDKKTGKWKKIEPNPKAYKNVYEPHDRGAILVASIFEAFMRLYNYRVQDLIRIATQGTGILPLGSIHPDLVKRLANEASDVALHLLSVCIRALDYSPPFDITFGTYLRSLITADIDLCSDENNNYRVALIEAFRAWGIFPDKVNTLSVYSLKWSPPEFTQNEKKAMNFLADQITEDIRRLTRITERETIHKESAVLQSKLHSILVNPKKSTLSIGKWKKNKLTMEIWNKFLQKIGIVLNSKPVVILYNKEKFLLSGNTPIEVNSVKPAFRVGKNEHQLEQVIITLTQSHKIINGEYAGMKFRSGSTIVLSISNNILNTDYIILKHFDSSRRLSNQINYQYGFNGEQSMALSAYSDNSGNNEINFEKLHIH